MQEFQNETTTRTLVIEMCKPVLQQMQGINLEITQIKNSILSNQKTSDDLGEQINFLGFQINIKNETIEHLKNTIANLSDQIKQSDKDKLKDKLILQSQLEQQNSNIIDQKRQIEVLADGYSALTDRSEIFNNNLTQKLYKFEIDSNQQQYQFAQDLKQMSEKNTEVQSKMSDIFSITSTLINIKQDIHLLNSSKSWMENHLNQIKGSLQNYITRDQFNEALSEMPQNQPIKQELMLQSLMVPQPSTSLNNNNNNNNINVNIPLSPRPTMSEQNIQKMIRNNITELKKILTQELTQDLELNMTLKLELYINTCIMEQKNSIMDYIIRQEQASLSELNNQMQISFKQFSEIISRQIFEKEFHFQNLIDLLGEVKQKMKRKLKKQQIKIEDELKNIRIQVENLPNQVRSQEKKKSTIIPQQKDSEIQSNQSMVEQQINKVQPILDKNMIKEVYEENKIFEKDIKENSQNRFEEVIAECKMNSDKYVAEIIKLKSDLYNNQHYMTCQFQQIFKQRSSIELSLSTLNLQNQQLQVYINVVYAVLMQIELCNSDNHAKVINHSLHFDFEFVPHQNDQRTHLMFQGIKQAKLDLLAKTLKCSQNIEKVFKGQSSKQAPETSSDWKGQSSKRNEANTIIKKFQIRTPKRKVSFNRQCSSDYNSVPEKIQEHLDKMNISLDSQFKEFPQSQRVMKRYKK